MKSRISAYLCALLAFAALCISQPVWAEANMVDTGKAESRDGRHTWIERPWDTRYFILTTEKDSWPHRRARAAEWNAKRGQRHFRWYEYFDPTAIVEVKRSEALGPQDLAVILIEFDLDGNVTTKNSHPGPLRGHLNRLQSLVLSAGDGPADRVFTLASWFTGLGDASTDWAPAFCGGDDMPNAAMVRSEIYLYGKLFKPNESSTTFGCREWAYQLYDDERPYIDVTSYVNITTGHERIRSTRIQEFIGWARFGDKKPIIGKNEDAWYCLHDCPGGAAPGLIPDIKAWAAQQGWPVPKPPTKAPTFPDPPAVPGTYPR